MPFESTFDLDNDCTRVVNHYQITAHKALGWISFYYAGTTTSRLLLDLTDIDLSQLSSNDIKKIVRTAGEKPP